jgi:succinate-semialdehyde dehydrogenase / glutarate-semialdehyde dehydrogenase
MPEQETGQIPQLTTYGCWIDGKEVFGKRTYPLVDPSTGRIFAHATTAEKDLVDTALGMAQTNLHNWRSKPASFRTHVLTALASLVRKEAEGLTAILCQEVGKPVTAARDEVFGAADLIEYFAQESLRLTGQIPLLGFHRERVMIVREPVGVVVAITPFNYPLATLVCKVAPALAVGCTVVAKPDEHTPLTTLKLAQMAIEAGLPAGVWNVLTGHGPETGQWLVDHPVPRLIAFTGSTTVGKLIQRISSKWVRKVVSELGGHCPAIVCSDAPWPNLMPQIVSQSFKNCGQYCYRISRIYVDETIYRDFVAAFVEYTSRLRVGPAEDLGSDLGPMNNAEARLKLQGQVKQAQQEGVDVMLGGSCPDLSSEGFYYLPTVLTNVKPGMAVSKEEIFGPVVIISPFNDTEAAIQEANDTPYGLGAYLFTSDLANALEWAGRLEVGSVWINKIHQAYPEAPFGGMKESGLGREKSRFGIEEYTELKTIYFSY